MDMMLEQFKIIFDRPEKVKKLRETILDLAVRGKLVEQDPNDEPASVLLERIREEKEMLVKEGKLKKEKPLAEIREDEKPYELPEGWEWVRFAESVTNIKGVTYKKNVASNEEKDGYELILRGGNIDSKSGALIINDNIYIPQGIIKDEQFINEGDTLMVASSGTKSSIAKSTYINFRLEKTSVGAFLYIIRPFKTIECKYINILVQKFRQEIIDTTAGTNISNVNKSSLDEFLTPLPPLEEQKRIVEKVDSLMAFCDKLEKSLEKKVHYSLLSTKSVFNNIGNATTTEELEETLRFILSNFKDLSLGDNAVKELKNCILQLAVQGKLVPQDPSDEPAEVLLEKIQEEKERLIKENKIKKEKPLVEISEEEKPYELSEGWKWSRLIYITSLITDGKHGDCTNQEKSEYYFLSAKDVINDKLSYTNARQITYEDFEEVNKRTNLEPYDILVPNTGASIGKIAIAEDNELTYRTTFQKSIAVIKPLREYIDEKYLVFVMRGLLQQMKTKSSGTAMINLLLRELREFVIPVPPLAEQKRIVEKVDSLMQLCEELEKKIERSKNYSNRLMESILKSSF